MPIIRDTDPGRLLTRRAFLIGGLQLGFFGLLYSRLYSLQIGQGDRYRTMADDNRISTRLILPERGLILDRNGSVLARSDKNFRADIIPEQAPNVKETLEKLYAILPFEESEKQRILKDLRRGKYRLPVMLKDNLDWDTLSLLELRLPDLPGMTIDAGEIRSYPFKEATAHVLGYVGPPTEEEAGDSELLNEPGIRIGKSGIEKSYDEKLQGEPGSMQLEMNAYGQQVRELTREPATAGNNLKLTLDINLQQFAQARLSQERSASAVVMDAVDGSIYAMVSQPSFDANLFANTISRTEWSKLNTDPLTPMLSKTVTGAYAPGSTYKVIVALAALANGISPHTHFNCPGHLDFGNHRFHCWKKGGHGSVDMHHGIVQSCDVFFYQIGRQLGADKIAVMANVLGLGVKTNIDLPHEKAGLVPTTAWKSKNFKEGWQQGENLVAAIGQGYTLTTPLQLAVATSRIVNGGMAVKPHLAANNGVDVFPVLGLKKEHLEFVRQAMIDVVQPGGTAAGARIGVPGYEMGGKTGTSQVRRITRAERSRGVTKNEDLPWEERDHALFISFAPTQNPRYVAAVVVEHGGGGSKVAAPIARDLLIELMKTDPARVLPTPLVMPENVKPTGRTAPEAPADNTGTGGGADDDEQFNDYMETLTPEPGVAPAAPTPMMPGFKREGF
jgi:penicillin-binding protein 2